MNRPLDTRYKNLFSLWLKWLNKIINFDQKFAHLKQEIVLDLLDVRFASISAAGYKCSLLVRTFQALLRASLAASPRTQTTAYAASNYIRMRPFIRRLD